MKLVRYIAAFDKITEELMDTIYLQEFSLEKIGPLFERFDDRMMFLCYEITPDLQSMIEQMLSVSLDLSRFDYFLECGTSADETLPGVDLGSLDPTSGVPPPLDPPAWIEDASAPKPKTSA